MEKPKACFTALAIAGATGINDGSPMPFAPNGPSKQGSSINAISINGKTINDLTRVTGGTYKFTYTVSEDDGDVLQSEVIPFSIILNDAAGNQSIEYTQINLSTAANACPGIDSNTPVIQSVDFSPGSGTILAIDDSVEVVVTLAQPGA